jgi:hypothetical protein
LKQCSHERRCAFQLLSFDESSATLEPLKNPSWPDSDSGLLTEGLESLVSMREPVRESW